MIPPVLYVLAGPNGIGKTTATFNILPQDLPIINSDEISKHFKTAEVVKVSAQEYGNREAQKLVQLHVETNISFAIETNLADEETWKFLKGIKAIGYRVHLIYLFTDDLNLLYKRIYERALRGEHFIKPDVVEERYHVSLKLLSHYFTIPDVVQLIDNSLALQPIAIREDETCKVFVQNPPAWFINNFLVHFFPTHKEVSVKNLSSIEDVKKHYQQKQKGNDDSSLPL